MTTRTWNGNLTDNFYDPSAWTPAGVPQSNDTLIISNGNPIVTGQTLSSETIVLGGTIHAPGPAYTSVPGDIIGGILGLDYILAPNPTLTLISSTIGRGTTVRVPATLPLLGTKGPDTATLFITGGTVTATGTSFPVSENDGVVETAGSSLFTQGGTLNLSIGNAIFENRGTILASEHSRVILTGYEMAQPPRFLISVATMHNDGVINVHGYVADTTVNLEGAGTVDLGSTPNLFGLSRTPGRFEFDNLGETIAATQNFVFQGGDLDLHPSNTPPGDPNGLSGFDATLSNFGRNPTDLISINDFNVSGTSYASGVLSLSGTNRFGFPSDISLHFANLPLLGHFAFSNSNNVTDITWQPAGISHPGP
jgi:hypothetical protein